MTTSPARLHVLLASENDFALVIRRGPTKQVCTLGWNRRHDTFELGQWLKGKIDFGSCDLSPDGAHFLYSASKWSGITEKRGSYTVLSRAPFLKKLCLWGPNAPILGGVFLDNTRFRLNKSQEPTTFRLPDFAPVETQTPSDKRGFIEGGVRGFRLKRDGWILPPDYDGRRTVWHQTLGEWTLALFIHHWRKHKPDFYELRHNATDEVVASGEWDWADFDATCKRLCLAHDGQLWALDLKPDATQKLLHDFNAMTFEPIAAPY